MIVGLAAAVMELDRFVSHGDGMVRGEGFVRSQRAAGKEASRRWVGLHGHADIAIADTEVEVEIAGKPTELAVVDDQVPVVRVVVAVEAGGNVFVADHVWVVVAEERAAAHVIGMTMGVDEVLDRQGRPGAERSAHGLSGVHPGGVEAHQTLCVPQGNAMAEALHHRHTVGDLAQLVGDTIDGLVGETAVDNA
ncbi:unannotated protein [freshwater metagenome]|uniref:Unannotated protein n=1 Tax=freshwater metagenome TaxID=449393 RepID=A0A6J7C7K7_9ZZZZ